MAGLQGLPDLASLEGLSPYLNQAGMRQVQDAQAFNQVGLQQNQAALEEANLKNLFSRANNPQLLEQQRLVNEGKNFDNMKLGVDARTAVALEPEAREAKRKELLKAATMADLQNLQAQAQMDLSSDDPAVVARGRKKMDASWEEITRRNTHKDTMEKTREEIQGRKDVANIGAGATVKAAQIGADSRVDAAKARAGTAGDFDAAVKAGKITPQKALVYWQNQAKNATNEDDRTAALVEAARYERVIQSTLPAVAGQGGKPDMSNLLNTPPKPNPTAYPEVSNNQPKRYNSLPQGATQIGTSKGKPVYQLPDGSRIIGE